MLINTVGTGTRYCILFVYRITLIIGIYDRGETIGIRKHVPGDRGMNGPSTDT